MSREAYAHGRRMTSRLSFVEVGTSSTLLVPAAAGRCGVRVSSPPANRVTVTDSGPAVLDEGWNLYPTNAKGLELCMAINGTITEKPLYAITTGAAQKVGVIETFLPSDSNER